MTGWVEGQHTHPEADRRVAGLRSAFRSHDAANGVTLTGMEAVIVIGIVLVVAILVILARSLRDRFLV